MQPATSLCPPPTSNYALSPGWAPAAALVNNTSGILKKKSTDRVRMGTLLRLHDAAMFTHLAQFFVITGLVLYDAGGDWSIASLGHDGYVGRWRYKLKYLLPAFPLLSALNHAVASFGGGLYGAVLTQQYNPYRWAEYSVSAGVMLWIICTLSGITDIRTLTSVAMLNATLQYVGYLIERGKQHNPSVVPGLLATAFAIHVAIWTQIFISFYTAVGSAGVEVPPAVYSIVVVMFALFTSFGVWSALWASSSSAIKSFGALESGYVVLSLVSKTLLIWMVYFGVNRPPQATAG